MQAFDILIYKLTMNEINFIIKKEFEICRDLSTRVGLFFNIMAYWRRDCMYLKRIEVKGFKSFAEKVDLEFGRGITAIVGPNGSGKSNISDSIRWVLGEQSAKTLRGGKMEDVIFSGTENRKSLGCAEVSLTIDNTSGSLPLDYSEITVTRRLYRSGESEYLINNSFCRLKDIVELFMDTGIGKDGYSLIGQGKIEEILSTKSEDRRNIFEEASGIVKYKVRKQEAEKKLDNTRQNLTRITDIINGLEEQIEPLKEQSIVAKQYLNLKEELKELEISIILNNFEASKKKLDKINEDIGSLCENKNIYEKNKQELVKETEALKNNLNTLENELESTNNDKFEAEKNWENKLGSQKLFEERKENYIKERERLERESLELKDQISRMNKEEAAFSDEKKNIEAELEERKRELDSINNRYDAVNQKSIEYEKLVENKKSEAIQLLKNISDINNKINTSHVMIDNLNNRKKQLEKDKKSRKETFDNLGGEISGYEAKLQEESKGLHKLKCEYEKITDKIALLEEENRKLINTRNQTYDRLKTIEARYNTLVEMERDMEGFNRAVKSIINNYSNDSRIYGVVSDLIEVPKGYEAAMEIALGPGVQNIVVDNEQTAGMLISYLKRNKQGRATFLPLTTIKPRTISLNKNVTSAKGYLGVASNIIKFDSKFNNVLSNLLGRVLICDNLENAGAIARLVDYSFRIVTLEGDVINTGGSFTGGSINSRGSGIFTRKNEINELQSELEKERHNLEAIEKNQETNSNEINKNRNSQNIILKDIQSITVNLQTEQNRIIVLKDQLNSYKEEMEDISIEALHIENQLKDNAEFLQNNIAELEKLNSIHEAAEREIEVLQTEQRGYQSQKESIWEEITKERILAAEINKSIEALENKILELQSERNNYNTKISNYKRNLQENQLKTQETINAISINSKEINQIKDNIEIIKNRASEIEEKIKVQLNEIDYKEKNLKNMEDGINSIILSIHKLEMSTSKLEAETDMYINKLWDEYELSIPQAVKYRKPLSNMTEANKRLNVLKTSIKELGDVNVNSIEEYKRVTERYEFLTTQRDDLCSAEESLLRMINEITKKMEMQFIEGFRTIREYFGITFKELFGGGYADLRLEGDDVLNTGIEIIVQPPGKKLQNLSLLSGGERGLAAIALVFAILKMKPTPFCVLDEIEAALDDANVNRFAKFLKEYSKNTQFIMITHRKGSMAVADALYGVTMEEKGVSKMISLKLKEEYKNELA